MHRALTVRLGIRAQLLLALGALLVLAFVPLFFAVASLARASLTSSALESARALGRVVSGYVAEARHARSDEALRSLADAQLGQQVAAIGLYDESGALVVRSGAGDALPEHVAARGEQVLDLRLAGRSAILVVVPGHRGPVATLLRTEASAAQVAPLVRLVALYTGLLAMSLLVFAYVVLTRIVVSPLDQLTRAARRVADGARTFVTPRSGGRELLELGQSVARMTDRLRAEEEELRDKVALIQRANEELRQAQGTLVRTERLASVGRLAAGLAHEIGNPIAAILGFQELMLDGELEEEQTREFTRRMKRETERVHRILRDLLDFARPAARRDGDDDEAGASASVAEAVEQVLALLQPQTSFEDVQLITAIEGELPPVAMRAERVEQLLLNLLMNAADVVPKPGGQVSVGVTSSGDVVRIAIEDNGGGIDPAIRPRLFEPFVSSKEVGHGTGLGLAVCRGLVESAGGTIRAEEGSEGARLVVELPVFRSSVPPS